MKILSLDGFCLIMSIALAIIPAWTSIGNHRLPTFSETLSILIAIVLASVTFFSANETSKELTRLNNRISRFSVKAVVDFSWEPGANPLLDNENDNNPGENELFWLITQTDQIKLFTPSGYSVRRTGATSAQFSAFLAPRNGEPPLGRQVDSIIEAKDFVIFVVVKNYWTNGRDQYPISIDRYETTFYVNDREANFAKNVPEKLIPTPAGNTIWGMLNISGHIEGGLGSLFKQ